MLMIAELCPASTDCRLQLARRCDEQLKQSFWLCKIVELVGRQIFVVDQLLKTRAVENVLSLLSAIIPFYVKDLLQRYYPLHLQEGRSTAGSYTRIRAVEQRFYDAIVVLATKKNEDQRKGLTILYLADQPSNTRIHGDEGQSKFITAWSCI